MGAEQSAYPRSCVVVGGGLAGLAAACALADRGWQVTLLEKRRWLGGRASSFLDPLLQHPVDLGQHVFMRCFTAYLDFLKRLGVYHKVFIQSRLQVPIVDAHTGIRGVLFSQPWLPSPLHLLRGFVAYPHLMPSEKARAMRGMLTAWRTDRRGAERSLESGTFQEWLLRQSQTPRIIQRLWEPIILATLNALPSQVSATAGLMVVQEALLAGPHTADIGWATVPLSPLVEEAVKRYLAERGGRVLTGVAVAGLMWNGDQVESVVLVDGQRVWGRVFVLAVPWDTLLHLLNSGWAEHPFFVPLRRLRGVPILNIHLWYDRPVMREPFVGFLNSSVQWVFNKTALWGLEGPGQYISITVSGAQEYVGVPQEQVLQTFGREMQRLFPEAGLAHLVHARAVVIRQATFCPSPGVEALRPPHQTPISNLFLAGDWTRTGWPSTMEGAVRSGLLAAQAVVRSFP
ncbi:MAG: hydroxysqualene dehydroxylase HpnE [Dehalococcoidia bacterium]|nr:hydroxysqualene dehydroxylase HpnE [Dehalococcoidia bacterium]MDW8120471.1 hydroxysqualene dehydroxylase HpnE [Chloroflexota bacterium]